MRAWAASSGRVVECVALLALLSGVASAVPQEPESSAAPQTPSPSPTPAPPLIPGPSAHVRPDDKRRTLRSYPHNLGYSFLSVVQRESHKSLLITTALTLPSFALDDDWEEYFASHPHEHFGDIGAKLGGSVAMAGLGIGLFSAGRISRGDTFRAASYDMSQAILINLAYTQAIKLMVPRERPDGSNLMSFPSGHASNAFAIASVVTSHYHKLAIPACAFAGFVAVSRMAAERHFFSDIVAGGGLGWTVGRAVVRHNGRPPDAKPGEVPAPAPPRLTWQLMPWAGASGDGRGLLVTMWF